jgi:hypothetical protein
MSEHIILHVNGTPRATDIDDAEMPLLYALRGELGSIIRISAAGSRNAAPARCM